MRRAYVRKESMEEDGWMDGMFRPCLVGSQGKRNVDGDFGLRPPASQKRRLSMHHGTFASTRARYPIKSVI